MVKFCVVTYNYITILSRISLEPFFFTSYVRHQEVQLSQLGTAKTISIDKAPSVGDFEEFVSGRLFVLAYIKG